MYEYSELKYKQYMKSSSWEKIKEEILKRDNYQCKICGNDSNLRVHHILYTVFNEKGIDTDTNLLMTLCSYCHDRVHQNTNNKFRSLQ